MSQQVWAAINPDTTSGTMLAGLLTDFKDALMTGLAGTTRPAQLAPGGMWIDTTLQSAPTYQWIYKVWTGSTDIEVFRINVSSNFGGALTSESIFEVQQISADAVGALQELIKQRIEVNGQVISGDTIGEIRMVGRANNGTDVTVGYIKWVATDDQEDTQSGGTFSFFSTPDASSVITEHLKAINGTMEVPVIGIVNSLRYATQDIATSTAIVQLSAAKQGIEFTGSTPTSVQGINSGQDSQEIMLHNRSTAAVTLKHQDGTAAANDRLKLPNSADYIISPQSTVTVYYCTTDARWKLRSSASAVVNRTSKRFLGLINSWTVPDNVDRITIYGRARGRGKTYGVVQHHLDRYGNAYSWGSGGNSGMGNGALTSASSPVAVIGGLQFKYLEESAGQAEFLSTQGYAIQADGTAWAWGYNSYGKLGVGDSNDRSSPVQIVGGLKFVKICPAVGSEDRPVFGITQDGSMYGWGRNNTGVGNNVGQIGMGTTTTAFSSPVAVFGGLKWEDVIPNDGYTVALTQDGVAYAWGQDELGTLGYSGGVGNTSSSPMLILGGLTFKKILARDPDVSVAVLMGLTPNGTLYAWGYNSHGQLGVGDVAVRSSPVQVLGGLVFTDILLTGNSAFGLTEDGTAYAWGQNNQGQLGVGDTTDRSSPVPVYGGVKFTKLFNQARDTIWGLTESGTLYAWGNNSAGILGVGDTTNRSSPVQVVGGIKFVDVLPAVGCFGVASDGQLYSWGRNDGAGYGGVGDRVDRSSPVAVIGAHGFSIVKEVKICSIPVVAGQTYDIRISKVGQCRFGNTAIGRELEEIRIEYEKRGN